VKSGVDICSRAKQIVRPCAPDREDDVNGSIRWWGVAAVACGLAFSGISARAEFPEKPVRFILGFSPGGGVDIQARIVADVLQKKWGQTIVIESRPGANGSIAAEFVSRTAPDGYTIAWVSNAHTATPSLLKLNYDAVKSFAPITQVTRTPDVLIVQSAFPANTLKELIDLARSKPGELNYASVGTGGSPFLEMEMLMKQTGIKLNHIPYKGGGDAVYSVLSGSTHAYFGVMGTIVGHIQAGQLKALALSSERRSAMLPDVPTVAEAAGLERFDAADSQWTGVLAPAGTPKPIVDKLYKDLAEVLMSSEVQKRMAEVGFIPVASTPEAFTAMMMTDIPKWAALLKDIPR
jgi:tripartite-type tricarboxylate transporter receptor subunit TctC